MLNTMYTPGSGSSGRRIGALIAALRTARQKQFLSAGDLQGVAALGGLHRRPATPGLAKLA
jgi:hypothetical protein